MGVDYSANFGFGVKILIPDLDNEEYDNDVSAWINEKLSDINELGYFAGGEGNYTGEQDDFYVVSKLIFNELRRGNYDISKLVSDFTEALKELGLEYEGNPCIVGDLHVW